MDEIIHRNKCQKGTVSIEFHADDFGLFPTQSQRIMDCHDYGNLNGISILPNSAQLDACMELFYLRQKKIAATIHLNLIEGKSVSDPKTIPLLTDQYGNLHCSFGMLLLRSFLPGKAKLLLQLKKEIRAQISAVCSRLPPSDRDHLRIDSHAHYHMLPVVFDAMMCVIREDHLPVTYIRIPKEHFSIYQKHWKTIRHFAPINLIKVIVLNLLAMRNQIHYGNYLKSLEHKLFMGVLLSGSMFLENVAPLIPDAVRLAEKKHCSLEILAHPGGIYEPEDISQLTFKGDVSFMGNVFRRKEASLFQYPTAD